MKTILLFLSCIYFSGCVSKAGKNIFLRSRLPTQTAPLLGDFDQSRGLFGIDANIESQRHTFQPTDDLVTNYHLDNDDTHFSDPKHVTLQGFDLSGTYRAKVKSALAKVGISFDFIDGQLNPSAALGIPDDWFLTFNIGYYQTTGFTSSGAKCSLICFDDKNEQAKQSAIENNIQTEQKGDESKVGINIGKLLSEKDIVSVSYNYMYYDYTVSAQKPGSPALYLRENSRATGEGMGYYRVLTSNNIIGVTVDNIHLHWRYRMDESIVFAVRSSLSF